MEISHLAKQQRGRNWATPNQTVERTVESTHPRFHIEHNSNFIQRFPVYTFILLYELAEDDLK